MNKNKGFAKGILIGGLVGSIAAILFAPKSGKETQADIKRKAKSMKHDLDTMLSEMQQDLVGRIDSLKDVAKDLKGEARLESEDLINRAEILKSDLARSASNISRVGGEAKTEIVSDAKRLIDEGSAVMSELERVTKKMLASAKEKIKNERSGSDGYEA